MTVTRKVCSLSVKRRLWYRHCNINMDGKGVVVTNWYLFLCLFLSILAQSDGLELSRCKCVMSTSPKRRTWLCTASQNKPTNTRIWEIVFRARCVGKLSTLKNEVDALLTTTLVVFPAKCWCPYRRACNKYRRVHKSPWFHIHHKLLFGIFLRNRQFNDFLKWFTSNTADAIYFSNQIAGHLRYKERAFLNHKTPAAPDASWILATQWPLHVISIPFERKRELGILKWGHAIV